MTEKILIDRAVVEQALEACSGTLARCTPRALQALRAALEQPQVEQEPVAWAVMQNGEICWDADYPFSNEPGWSDSDQECVPLYTHPQPPVVEQSDGDTVTVPRSLLGAACAAINRKQDAPRLLEQLRRYTTGDLSKPLAPGCKATKRGDHVVCDACKSAWDANDQNPSACVPAPPVVEQEPVAWMFHAGDVWKFRWHHFNRPTGDDALKYWNPLYTSQQRLRQPLTDEQIHEAAIKANGEGKLSWTGFQLDNNGEYTIPLLSLCHYQLARAIELAHGIGK